MINHILDTFKNLKINEAFLSDKSYKFDAVYYVTKEIDKYEHSNKITLKDDKTEIVKNITNFFALPEISMEANTNFLLETLSFLCKSKVLSKISQDEYKILDRKNYEFILSCMENTYIFEYLFVYSTFLNDGLWKIYCEYIKCSNAADRENKIRELKSKYENIWGKTNDNWTNSKLKFSLMNLGLVNNGFEITRSLKENNQKIIPLNLCANKQGSKSVNEKDNFYIGNFRLQYVKEILKLYLVNNVDDIDTELLNFKNILAFFVKQLNINNGIEEGTQKHVNGGDDNAKKLIEDWNHFDNFSLACRFGRGYQTKQDNANYIFCEWVNINPHFNDNNSVESVQVNVKPNMKLSYQGNSYLVDSLDLYSNNKPNDSLRKLFDEFREKIYESKNQNKNSIKKINFSTGIFPNEQRNKIYFGAPGTGKSYNLNKQVHKLISNGGNFERVTFHPDYSYANFVGTYKPTMISENTNQLSNDSYKKIIDILIDQNKSAQEKYDILYKDFNGNNLTRLPILLGLYTDEEFKTKKSDGSNSIDNNTVERNHGKAIRPFVNLINNNEKNQRISYEYVPGPFMRVLVSALKSSMTNSPKPYVLVIEEINRANIAAVFGDVFQLLDRDSQNVSEYSITTTNDMRKYLSKELNVEESEITNIKIPDNMFIWATMNSADQGVFPMDTAFKRRWDFEYIDIDSGENEISGKSFIIGKGSNKIKVEWNELRKAINNSLLNECKLNEDKLMGPFFMSPTVLSNSEKFITTFKNKVIMYLFEDAAKQKRSTLFEGCYEKSKTYSSICKAFEEKGIDIFCENIKNNVPFESTDELEGDS